jgi:hypothetical protein
MLRTHLCLALTATIALAGCLATPDEFDGDDEETSTLGDELRGTVIGAGATVRQKPSTKSTAMTVLTDGTKARIKCQISGESVSGNSVWNYLSAYNGYVSATLMKTGYTGFIPGVAKCDSSTTTTPPPPAPSGDSSLGTAIVTKGRNHIGYEAGANDCNKFSTALGNPCQAWCGDFVRYVWGQAGAKTTGLTGYSGSFRDYGMNHGTWKTASATPKVGDAVVWQDATMYAHVAIISAVNGSTFRILHGNYDNDGDGYGEVYETSGYVNSTNTAGIPGGHIVGFASPVQ